MTLLEIDNLQASVAGTRILRGVTLSMDAGQVHAVMGPNGSGKSTLSHVLMGRPGYEVTAGSVRFDGADLLAMTTWERAQAGLFLAMQYPIEIPGVQLEAVMTQVAAAGSRETGDLMQRLGDEADALGVPADFLSRGINVDMSGGEKKRSETLQLAALRPRLAILDELDSGLDVDGLRTVSRRVEQATDAGLGVLAITHYNRLLEELRPDVVHVFVDGIIQESGGPELATELEETGYDRWIKPIETGVSLGGLGGLGGADDPFADPFA